MILYITCVQYANKYTIKGKGVNTACINEQDNENSRMMYKIYNKKIKKSIVLCILNIKK